MYTNSEESKRLQYTGHVGDGDSKKSFSSMKASKSYANKDIMKYECVGHVQERMGTALRKLKAEKGKQKLRGGKTISGIGRLTNARIDKLQVYYGLAIRCHKHDLEGMEKEDEKGYTTLRRLMRTVLMGQIHVVNITWDCYRKSLLSTQAHCLVQLQMN